MRNPILSTLLLALLAGCSGAGEAVGAGNGAAGQAPNGQPFIATPLAQLSQPWAMTFLPRTNQALITEKRGRLLLWREGAAPIEVAGVPAVDYGGQGGLGDVVLHPNFASNRVVYLSWAEAGQGDTRGAAVGRARLVTDGSPRLEGMQVIWRQEPKVAGRGHYGHRLAFSPDGRFLFITSGEREKFEPAQDMNANLGKVLRLTDTGGVPPDNPFYGRGRIPSQIWSLGHRNPLGIAFAPDGQLWTNEMGPRGGDEMNRIERGSNYGYPIVSNGDHYSGREIPDHDTRPEFNAPEITWASVISPSSLIFYSGNLFPRWRGSALIGALSGQALVRVAVNGPTARELERFPMGQRIREVEQGPDGAIYLLEDQRSEGGAGGRLLRLTPRR